MTFLDDKLVPKVTAIVAKFGVAVTFYTQTDSYDEATGVNTRVEEPISAKALPRYLISKRSMFTTKLVDGETIKRGDVFTVTDSSAKLASLAPYVPTIGDEVLWFGETKRWTILAISSLETGEKSAGYEMHLRRT